MKQKIKKAPITLSRIFPVTHSKAGQLTNFREKVMSQMRGVDSKKHTIRSNFDWWARKFEGISIGEMYLSLREWTGKPYNSPQDEWLQLHKIGLQQIEMVYGSDDAYPRVWIDNKEVAIQEVAQNDGLSVEDFVEWFFGSSKSNTFEGVIIHFTDFRY